MSGIIEIFAPKQVSPIDNPLEIAASLGKTTVQWWMGNEYRTDIIIADGVQISAKDQNITQSLLKAIEKAQRYKK